MKFFITDDFLLQSDTAKELYHDHAKDLPIIDYHCHLPPDEVAADLNFENITQIWLKGDHYKWRALRAYGISEKYITGDASDKEKFMKWAEVTPHTLRNPLYHWSHLELLRYFGISEYLNLNTADRIWEETQEKLQSPEYSTQSLINKMNVEVIGTTDDPVDNLKHHKKLQLEETGFKLLPSFRPDKAMDVSDPAVFNVYRLKLEQASGISVSDLDSYLDALKQRHDEFHETGCRVSDHGLTSMDAADFTLKGVTEAFKQILSGKELDAAQQEQLRSFLLIEFAKMDHEKGWVQQYHLGPIRNTNSRLLGELGPDTGFDSIGDYPQAEALAKFLDRLDSTDQLAKTILYNVNPAYNEVFATMAGNFNDGTVKGKMQWGSAWWFLDQLDGMEKQINTLSSLGLLSTFVGMLTDSRSFMSYPRHEYFRRLLCNMLGEDVEKGMLPKDMGLLSALVKDVSYFNAKAYFNF
jgi:glucuronate isomerase